MYNTLYKKNTPFDFTVWLIFVILLLKNNRETDIS